MGAKRKREERQARPYKFTPAGEQPRSSRLTPAQELMRQEMEASREPVKLGDVLDEVFQRMEASREEAERRYPPQDAVDGIQRSAFIAGAEWWASYGL